MRERDGIKEWEKGTGERERGERDGSVGWEGGMGKIWECGMESGIAGSAMDRREGWERRMGKKLQNGLQRESTFELMNTFQRLTEAKSCTEIRTNS